MFVMFSVVFPTLARVTDFVYGPQKRLQNTRLVGTSFTTVPVPVKPTFCGLSRALSAIERLAFRELMFVGVNVTLIVQLAPRY